VFGKSFVHFEKEYFMRGGWPVKKLFDPADAGEFI
jgi:hypothetical protein